jgi:MSHA biogenesis protein MshP
MILLVAVVASGLARLVSLSAAERSIELLRTRALAAAESGADLALNRIVAPAGAGSCADRDFAFPVPGLSGCTAVTTCAVLTVDGVDYHDVRSTGQCGSGDEAAARTVALRALAP